MHPTKFRYIWPNSFRGEEFLKSANQKQESPVAAMFVNGLGQKNIFFQKAYNHKHELPVAAMFVNGSGRNEQSLQRTFHRCFLPTFSSFGPVVSEKIFKNRPIRNKNCLWRPLMDRDEISNLYRGPSKDASYQVLIHLAWRFQRRRFFSEINQSETRMACGGNVC